MQDLALEVGQLDLVLVDQAQRANARRGQVERGLASPVRRRPTTTTRACRRLALARAPPTSGRIICRP